MKQNNYKKTTLRALVLIFALSLTLSFVGCNSTEQEYSGAKVIFELEGGTYKNCVLPVTHYYDIGEGETDLIADPLEYSADGITRSGYTFTGWYKTKTQNGDEVTYSDKWDFSKDVITESGITLYAGWEKETKFTYSVCYYDENGEIVVIDTYKVNAGAKFDDYAKYANKRIGYTAIPSRVSENGDIWVYRNADGSAWDSSFTHPGNENQPDVKVFVEYVKGTYVIATKASDLKRAKSSNVYLACDIDLEGESLNFGDYKKTFLGNGHTISNFSISYDNTKNGVIPDFEDQTLNSLYVSLFGNAEGAVVKDVTFDKVSVVVNAGYNLTNKIYVAPLFSGMSGCTVQNVVFNATYSYEKLPSESFIEEQRLVYVTDRVYYLALDENSTVENAQVNVTVE